MKQQKSQNWRQNADDSKTDRKMGLKGYSERRSKKGRLTQFYPCSLIHFCNLEGDKLTIGDHPWNQALPSFPFHDTQQTQNTQHTTQKTCLLKTHSRACFVTRIYTVDCSQTASFSDQERDRDKSELKTTEKQTMGRSNETMFEDDISQI